MKILFVGDLNTYGRTYQRYRVLQSLGHEVIAHSSVPVPLIAGIDKPNLYYRIMWKLGYHQDMTCANRKIIEIIKLHKPELFWNDKALAIGRRTLEHIKQLCPDIKMIFNSEDDMYSRHNQSVQFRNSLHLYEIIFTSKTYNVKELMQIGARRVEFMDQTYDQVLHRPLALTETDKQRLAANVAFIGAYEDSRAEYMLFLANHGISVRVWGIGWSALKKSHSNLIVEGVPIYNDEYVKALCASKISLCFLRKANRDLQTSRTFEIPACGVFMLAERTDEHLRLFKEGQEAEYFDTKEELLEKTRYYLKHDKERERIATAGRKRCIESGYSHHDKIIKMLNLIENSCKN
jgi:spore maturation protein CgeB